MANKRALKRSINFISEELFAEAIAASLYGNENDKSNAEALFGSIIRLQADYVSRISHPEPGMAPKAYFQKLREGFAEQVSELIDHINNL